ncbi:hypothetical protein KAH81_01680 [bacterium]|nr:hypothetical protein [bacterium]
MLPQKVKTNAVIFKVLGWIYIVLGVLLGIGIIVFVVGFGTSTALGEFNDVEGAAFATGLSIVLGVIGIILAIVFGIFFFLIAKNLPLKKNWAKTLGIIFSILLLFSFPIGTVLGIILLVNFFSEEFKNWWESTEA